MRNINLSNKITICCAIFLWTVGAHASTLPPDPDNAALLYYQAFLLRPEPDPAAKHLVYNIRQEDILKALCGGEIEGYANLEERIRELEEKLQDPNLIREMERKQKERLWHRGGEILTSQMIQDDHEVNQYFLEKDLYEELRERQEHMGGTDPNEKIREYLRSCSEAIKVAESASHLSKCDWGIQYSKGLGFQSPQLVEIRPLTGILCADALRLAADGNCRAAFERCLMIRRFAHHIGDGTYVPHCVSRAVDSQALNCIKLLLGYMKPDADTLTWLENRLGVEKGSSASPGRVLKMDFEITLQTLRNNASVLDRCREAMRIKDHMKALAKKQLEQDRGDDEHTAKVQDITDEQLLALASKPYANFLDSALRVIDSEISYEKKRSEIQRLTEALEKEFGHEPATLMRLLAYPEKLLTLSIVMACAEQVLRFYDLEIRHTANFNALMAAIDVYLVVAKTGQLPEKLPDGLPKDPYSDRDFDYEITDEGFALPCQGKFFHKHWKPLMEFKVKR